MRTKHIIFLSLFFYCSLIWANTSIEFQIESLLREKQPDQALEALTEKKAQITKASYYRLKGMAHYLKNEQNLALNFFEKSLEESSQAPVSLLISLAQVYLKTQSSQKALKVLSRLKKDSIQKEILWSQALWSKGQKERAVDYLKSSEKKYSDSLDLILKQKAYYLYNLNRIKQIFDFSKIYFLKPEASVEVGLYAVSLLKEKDDYLAEQYFDLILSLRPKEALLLKERGVFALEKKQDFVASLFFDKAAHLDKKYAFAAASVHLDLGHHERALFFNSKVGNLKKQTLQKFMIYLDSENFEKALSLKYELQKRELLKKDKVAYALMYAAFKVRDYRSFSNLIAKITSKNYLSKVLKLKEVVESCQKSMELRCVFS